LESQTTNNEKNAEKIITELRPLLLSQIKDRPEHGCIQVEIRYRNAEIQQLILRSEKSLLFK
jgi:hypothetical protein